MKRLKKTANVDISSYTNDIFEVVRDKIINETYNLATDIAANAGLDPDDDDDKIISVAEGFTPDEDDMAPIKSAIEQVLQKLVSDMQSGLR